MNLLADAIAAASFAAAGALFGYFKEKGQLPGWSKDDKGSVTVHLRYAEAFPESATCDGQRNGDPSVFHHTTTRVSKDSPWKLQRAWRTDANGHLAEEYPIP
ncbi:MAG: hypothetical protein WBN22_01435 [Verrucomicrobiia bacterium]